MKNTIIVALALILPGLSGLTFAESDEDITRSLTVQCSYSDFKTFQFETVSIEKTKEYVGDVASTKIFKRGEKSEDAIYIVNPGEVAECIFPSGNRVRTKVGEGTAGPGMCGGDPEVFGSIWVNGRKIASRVWFTGHCREENGNPDVSFKYSGYGKISVEKCHSGQSSKDDASDSNSKAKSTQPLSVCVDIPEISRFPRDELEYPRPGKKVPVVGEIERLSGSHEVCKAALEELKADFNTFGQYPDQETIKLTRPHWNNDPSVELPKELLGSSEGVFDFDNDGRLDRVFQRNFETHYMDGSVLLVQPGTSSSTLSVPASPMDKTSWFIPCQLSSERYEILDCPTFSQKGDDAGFSMKGRANNTPIYFLARYSSVSPFTFRGENFIGVSSKTEDAKDFVAVLRPMPNRTFQPMCLFRQVPENF